MTGPDAAGLAGRAATPVCLVGRHPPDVAALLPGLGLALADGARCRLLAGPDSARMPRDARPLLHFVMGPLQTPRFLPGPPWLSGTVAGGWSAGTPTPGSAEVALWAGPDDPALLRRAAAGAAMMVRHRVGGAAWADPPDAVLARPGTGLAVVQASGDPGRDLAMLDAVLARRAAAGTVVVAPPCRMAAAARAAGCRVLHGPADPWPLLDLADEVHVAGGDALGLLGLLAGRTVHAHAPAWFAGWGVTEDGPAVPPRAATRSPAQVAAAGLLTGAAYCDPFTGQPASFESALDIAADWRRLCDANRGIAGCVGMQFWKRRRIGAFLHTGVRAPPQGAPALAAARRTGGAVAAWASRMPEGLREAGVPVLQVEDGFLRSVGLGSDFLPPCSIIVDGTGIYYDPSRPSDLETMLATMSFDRALLDRAAAVVDRLVRTGVTKYNVGVAPLPQLPAGRVILVPGQVGDDLSVRLGGGAVRGNLALLQAVRRAAPDAHILYKPHPDVDAGHRSGAIPDAQALEYADQLVRGVPMAALIAAVPEVHTLTSLTGFEALLRGRAVTCWGQPFYAGWGLTRDMAPLLRRNRELTLYELAAGVLLMYPRYLDPVTGLPCPAEVLLDRLARPDLWPVSPLVRLRRLQGGVAGWMAKMTPKRTTR